MSSRRVSKAQAQDIARDYAETQGWPWRHPIRVYWEFRTWRVFAKADARGGNVTVRVHAVTGEVTNGGFAAR